MSRSFDTEADQPLVPLTTPSPTSTPVTAVHSTFANKQILRALLSLASANLLIRVMGMFNQIVVTARFGQTSTMDAYFVASAVPTLLAQLLGSALEASVIPTYTRIRVEGRREEASRIFSTLLNLLLIGLTLSLLAMLLFRQQLIVFSAPALPSSSLQFAIALAPLIFPVLLFMVLNSFMECLLNTGGQFSWPAYAGILVPLTTVTFVLFAGKSYGVVMLCIGTLLGQILQLGALLLRMRGLNISYRLVLDLQSPEMTTIGIVAWPAFFTALISQASPLVDQMFASGLPVGSITVLNTALKLVSVPVGVIFASVGRAVLPYLARQVASRDMAAFKGTLRLYLWIVGLGTLGLTVLMLLLARPLVALLFQHGAFTAEDTERTASTLSGFCVGLTPMAFGFITSRAFSALGKTRTLLYVTIFSVVANALFDYLLGRLWQSFGIALATSAVYLCTMCLLLVTLRHSVGKLDLLTPPNELLSRLARIRRLLPLPTPSKLPPMYARTATRALIILVMLLGGILGTISNALSTLRMALGSFVILALLRYRYALLLAWIALDALIGSTLPFFNGQNFLSALTFPTLLLMFVIPIKPAFHRMPALAWLFAYLLWVLAGIGISPLALSTFLTIWLGYLAYVAIGVLVITLVTTRKRLLILVDALLLQGLFLALYGLYGYLTRQNGLADATTPALYRIGSVFAAPPTLAFFLSLLLPLALYRTLTVRGFQRILSTLVTLIFLLALALTFTRGAFLSVPLSLLVMAGFLPSRQIRRTLLGSVVVGIGLVVGFALVSHLPILDRFFTQDVTTLNGRTYLWSALLDHFSAAQLLGNGLNASDVLLSQLHVGFGRGVIGTAPHNLLLGTLYDHGIIGLALIILVLLSIPWSLLARMRTASPEHRTMLAMALAAFLSLLIQSMEVTVIWSQPVGVYVWILLSLPFSCYWLPLSLDEPHTDTAQGTTSDVVPTIKQEQLSHV